MKNPQLLLLAFCTMLVLFAGLDALCRWIARRINLRAPVGLIQWNDNAKEDARARTGAVGAEID